MLCYDGSEVNIFFVIRDAYKGNLSIYIRRGVIVKAVIFDLYETLITEWKNFKYTGTLLTNYLDVNPDDFIREWKKLQNDRYLGKYKDTQSAISHILFTLNHEVDTQLVEEIGYKRDNNKKRLFLDIKPEIHEMLKTLKEKGYKLGLISNCSHEEVVEFKNCKIFEYFDAVLLSCEVGMVKPDRRIYEACMEQLSVISNECLYVGDGGSNELLGATQCGMYSIKAVWFLKEFMNNYDDDKSFPLIFNPKEVVDYVELLANTTV